MIELIEDLGMKKVSGQKRRIGLYKCTKCGKEKERRVGAYKGCMYCCRKTHGGTHTNLYSRWIDIKSRCYNTSRKDYPRYGGLGTTMCDEWLNDFSTFKTWALNNGYRKELTIDRKNPYGNYEPDNCRWATILEQNNNKRKDYDKKIQTKQI